MCKPTVPSARLYRAVLALYIHIILYISSNVRKVIYVFMLFAVNVVVFIIQNI